MYMYVNGGVSNGNLFPKYRIGSEIYQKLPKSFEASFGFRHLRFQSSNVTIFTGSIGKYYRNYWFSLRPFITLSFGNGFSPDNKNRVDGTGDIYQLQSYKAGFGFQKTISTRIILRGNIGYGYQELEFRLGDFLNRYSFSLGINTLF